MDFLSLPVVMIENVFSYLSYDEIAKNRVICKAFNEICMRMLNRGFLMIERRHALALKTVKAQLPRRESERRYHPLSRHSDILTSIETRISMLNMTYLKFIDNGLCCFIPGKVIDEIRRVLYIVETSKTPPRAHEVLQELRDISSMAIEHFDDKISPAFRKKLQEGVVQPSPRPTHAVLAPLAIKQEMINMKRTSILNAKLSLCLSSQVKTFSKKIIEYKRIAWRQRKTISDLLKKQREQNAAIAELKKRIEECDIKYSELTHTNQAVGGKVIASASASEVASTSSQPLRHFGSQIKLDLSVLPIGSAKRNHSQLLPNIKPRKPLIKLPSLCTEDQEPPRKMLKISPKRPSQIPSAATDGQNQSLRTKSQSAITKIRDLANEITQITNISKSLESTLKRPLNLSSLDLDMDVKKQKLD